MISAEEAYVGMWSVDGMEPEPKGEWERRFFPACGHRTGFGIARTRAQARQLAAKAKASGWTEVRVDRIGYARYHHTPFLGLVVEARGNTG